MFVNVNVIHFLRSSRSVTAEHPVRVVGEVDADRGEDVRGRPWEALGSWWNYFSLSMIFPWVNFWDVWLHCGIESIIHQDLRPKRANERWYKHMGLSENSVPLHPMVNDHYPVFKWLFHWEYTLFSDIPIYKNMQILAEYHWYLLISVECPSHQTASPFGCLALEPSFEKGAFGLGGGQVVHAGELRRSSDLFRMIYESYYHFFPADMNAKSTS